MSIRVFIDGGEGTTGLRLADRLADRPDIRLLSIDPALRKDEKERARVADSADIVFLCLPDDAARAAVRNITNPALKVIDASTAHRTAEGWAYGLPELSAAHREAVASSKRVSVPGCHAMGFNCLVHPLTAGGILPPGYPVTCHSLTGYSGAGKGVIAQYEAPDRAPYHRFPRQYALTQQHKHLPEMQKVSGLAYPPVFNPIIGDFYVGMLVTVPLHTRLLERYRSAEDLQKYLKEYYSGQKLIKVMDFGAEAAIPGGMLDPGALAGLDRAEIYVCGGGERVILAACLDNLGKGASGAAIQCMNILCGLEETTGLSL